MDFKVLSVTGNDTRVEFTLNDLTKITQNLANVPVEDKDAAKAFLTQYVKDLQAGFDLQKELALTPTPATGLVGVKVTVDSE